MSTTDYSNDDFYFEANGSITAVVDGVQYKMRRARLGELRTFEALALEIDMLTRSTEAALKAAVASQVKVLVDASAEAGDAVDGQDFDIPVEALQAYHTKLEDIDKMIAAWNAAVISQLSAKSLPGPDDLPAWLADKSSISDILAHWRSVPSRSQVALVPNEQSTPE